MSVDILKAVRAFLLADSTITAEVSTRVFALELPKAEAESMPRKCVVLSLAGGSEPRDYVRRTWLRLDVWNYGLTPIQTMDVQRVTHYALKELARTKQGDTLLHNAAQSSGPRYFKTPDEDWPVTIESWMVLASEVTAV